VKNVGPDQPKPRLPLLEFIPLGEDATPPVATAITQRPTRVRLMRHSAVALARACRARQCNREVSGLERLRMSSPATSTDKVAASSFNGVTPGQRVPASSRTIRMPSPIRSLRRGRAEHRRSRP
jgi:hypothetical protein